MNRRKSVSRLSLGAAGGLLGLSFDLSSKHAAEAESVTHKPDFELIMSVRCAHACGSQLEGFNPDTVRQWVALCADLGATSIMWWGGYVGTATYHSKVLPRMRVLDDDYLAKRGVPRENDRWEGSKKLFNPIAKALAQFDTLDIALAEAQKRGMKFYSNLNLFDMYFPALENDFFEDQPQYWVLSRDQKTPYRGLPCYTEKAVQDYRLAEIQELLDRGVDGITLSLGSHVASNFWHGAPDPEDWERILRPDSFGFNPPVVEAYRERYGVNIIEEDFDPDKLFRLNGRLFTEFLRRMREVLGPDRRLLATTSVDGYYGYGGAGGDQINRCFAGSQLVAVQNTPSFRFRLEWRKWIREGIADDLLVYAPMPDAVGQVHREIKSKLPKGRVLLQRRWYTEEQFAQYEEYRNELAAIRSGALDGYAIFELGGFLDPDSPLRGLLLKRG